MHIYSISSLIAQLIAVIVSYHDDQRHISQKLLKNTKLEPFSQDLANLPLDELKQRLNGIVQEITSGYNKQEALLSFLTGHILYLKGLAQRDAPIYPTETTEYVMRLLSDLCRILAVADGTALQVTHADGPQFSVRSVHGLGKIRGYCHSGQLIYDLVLKPLDIKSGSEKQDSIATRAQFLVETLMNAQKATRAEKLEVELHNAQTRNRELEARIRSLEGQVSDLTDKNKSLTQQSVTVDSRILMQAERIRFLEQQIRRLSSANNIAVDEASSALASKGLLGRNTNPAREDGNSNPNWFTGFFGP